jgi:chloramphenicol-sensitive protein RarD
MGKPAPGVEDGEVAGGVDLDRRGVAQGLSAHVLWGMFPAFWPLLDPAAPVEVLAHRILWTLLFMSAVLGVLRGWRPLRTLGAAGWLAVTAAATLIAGNWGLFIYGVAIDHVVDIALGYYISPLVSTALGVLVLRERPRRAQWVALGIAVVAVVTISIGSGRVPWLGLALAATFGTYGLLKKRVPLPSSAGLTAEGVVLGPLAAVFLVVWELSGSGTLTGHGPWHVLLLVAAGPVTALPLLLFGAAARRVPLSTLGSLTYITPTMQFLWGVLVLGEAMPALRWVGFALVWVALAVLTVDLVRATRGRRTPGPQPVRSTT